MEIHYLKPPAIEARVRAAIRRHHLARVTITTRNGETYEASAYPAPENLIVQQRQNAAAASRQFILDTINPEENLAPIFDPIAYGYDTTIQGALAQLLENLDAQESR